MVISSRRRLVAAVAVTAIGLSLGGCQKAIDVDAVNQCGVDVELQLDTVRETTSQWVTVRAGDQVGVASVGESTETLYVKVRAVGGREARSSDVPMTSLGKPPAGADYDGLLVLEGDRCP